MPAFKKKLKVFSILLGFIVVIFVVFSFLANVPSYFDPLNFCYIGIDNDILRGNQKTVKAAINQIKVEDPQAYKTLCENVDTIVEDYCRASDTRHGGTGDEIGLSEPGCFIRGSKIIYLIPSKMESDYVVNLRAETIKKYAYFSKNFWDNQ